MSRSRLAAIVAAFSMLPVVGTTSAQAEEAPTLRLRGGSKTVDAWRDSQTGKVWISPTVMVQADRENFEILVQRPKYDEPIVATWRRPSGDVVLPAGLIRGWRGGAFYGFFRMEVVDGAGRTLASVRRSFCPSGYDRFPATAEASDQAIYPDSGCYGNPFTQGQVWGIEKGWIASPYLSLTAPLPARQSYAVRIWITKPWRDALGLPPQVMSYPMTINEANWGGPGPGKPRPIDDRGPEVVPDGPDGAPSDLDPATLPDLRSLPAWNIGLRREFGRTLVAFNATVWNAGPAPLVVDAFREDGEETMRAYQAFFRDGVRIGTQEVGEMIFHDDPTHYHWHFTDFAEYRLLDADGVHTLTSGKQSFCLAPTDAQDVTVPGANWRPGELGYSRCGGPESVAIRETLPVGWGDTYHQGQFGQAFDVTDLPNGFYQLEVVANPEGNLLEGDLTNGSSRRVFALGGTKDRRTLVVAPYETIRA
ncbi:MAG: lysyl oxidase family protein [Actinomycetota bacterium]